MYVYMYVCVWVYAAASAWAGSNGTPTHVTYPHPALSHTTNFCCAPSSMAFVVWKWLATYVVSRFSIFSHCARNKQTHIRPCTQIYIHSISSKVRYIPCLLFTVLGRLLQLKLYFPTDVLVNCKSTPTVMMCISSRWRWRGRYYNLLVHWSFVFSHVPVTFLSQRNFHRSVTTHFHTRV